MRNLLLSIPILLLSLPLPLSAQNRECPRQGFYGAMSEVCPAKRFKSSAPLNVAEKRLYFTKSQQIQDAKERIQVFRSHSLFPCRPRWISASELNVQQSLCK